MTEFSQQPFAQIQVAAAAEEGAVSDPTLGTLLSLVVPFGGIFDRPPLRDANFEARTVEESFRRLDELLETPTISFTNLEILARLLRGTFFREVIQVSTSGDEAEDTPILHRLGRRPRVVMFSVDLEGLGGVVLGSPGGLNGAEGGNQTPWDSERIFVRATRSSTYEAITL